MAELLAAAIRWVKKGPSGIQLSIKIGAHRLLELSPVGAASVPRSGPGSLH